MVHSDARSGNVEDAPTKRGLVHHGELGADSDAQLLQAKVESPVNTDVDNLRPGM